MAIGCAKISNAIGELVAILLNIHVKMCNIKHRHIIVHTIPRDKFFWTI